MILYYGALNITLNVFKQADLTIKYVDDLHVALASSLRLLYIQVITTRIYKYQHVNVLPM